MKLKTKHTLIIKPFLVLVLLFTVNFALAQHKIVIQFQDNQDSVFYLARYFGEKFQLVDTSQHLIGQAKFEGQQPLPQGIYVLTDGQKNRLMDFLVGESQSFTLDVPKNNDPAGIRCENSKETALFFNQLDKTNQIYQQIKNIQADSIHQYSKEKRQQIADSLQSELITFREKIIEDQAGSLMAAIINAMKEPQIPDSLVGDQQASYRYFKGHFWETVDLTDERLLYTPLLTSKLNKYFDQLVPPVADSIIVEVDNLIARTQDKQIVRDYLIWHFTEQYQNPKIMGLDKVFVHLADQYFAKLEITNTTPSVKQKILDRANQLRNLVIGAPAPDLILVDTNDVFRSFKEIKTDYLVLFFWDFECSICKKELKMLKTLYDSKKYPIEVFAIGANADFDGWKKFIREHELHWTNVNGMKSVTPDFHDVYDIYGTPVIYLLDQHRNIIGKRITVEQIGMIIEHESEMKSAP